MFAYQKWRLLTFNNKNDIVFNLKKLDHLTLSNIEVVIQIPKKMKIVLHLKSMRLSSNWKKLRPSSIFKNIVVIFHILSSWVKISLHTKNQLPRLSRSALKVFLGRVVQLTLSLPTWVEVGLWHRFGKHFVYLVPKI